MRGKIRMKFPYAGRSYASCGPTGVPGYSNIPVVLLNILHSVVGLILTTCLSIYTSQYILFPYLEIFFVASLPCAGAPKTYWWIARRKRGGSTVPWASQLPCTANRRGCQQPVDRSVQFRAEHGRHARTIRTI